MHGIGTRLFRAFFHFTSDAFALRKKESSSTDKKWSYSLFCFRFVLSFATCKIGCGSAKKSKNCVFALFCTLLSLLWLRKVGFTSTKQKTQAFFVLYSVCTIFVPIWIQTANCK